MAFTSWVRSGFSGTRLTGAPSHAAVLPASSKVGSAVTSPRVGEQKVTTARDKRIAGARPGRDVVERRALDLDHRPDEVAALAVRVIAVARAR